MPCLSREATVAGQGFSRWRVPPTAIAVHLCIGQVYGLRVFNEPLAAALDAPVSSVNWAYQIALMMLGISAAVFGKWVEQSGPRKTMVAACLFFCGGLLLTALGVKLKKLWLILFGYGVVGGIRERVPCRHSRSWPDDSRAASRAVASVAGRSGGRS
jgi:MFS family permease